MEVIVIILYLVPTLILFSYSCAQLSLVWNYWQKKRTENGNPPSNITPLSFEFPLVTVQLPIYNELYVVERLIDAVCLFEYPKNRLEIQVLDDSTDDTVSIIAQKVHFYQVQGFDIQHIRRRNRDGFKAGALAYGLTTARGEFIAIFDADFIPNPDFLTTTIPHFENTHVGVVQTRWVHLNESYSLITQLQAFGLDGHFIVEQGGRNAAGHFINFNGTAGVWRKSCILDAGGWSAQTLTEDLDLSYRAQLRGWQFVYLENVETPAELPATMPALKSQQYRWMKGAAECARKNLKKVLQSTTVKFSTKVYAAFHLLNSGVFLAVFVMALLSVPILAITAFEPKYDYLFGIFRIFQLSFLMLLGFYGTTHYRHKTFGQFVWQLPFFLTVIMGLSLHNAIAALEGYLGKKTPFIRTPKWGIVQQKDGWQRKNYLVKSLNWLTIAELLLAVYFAAAVGLGFYWHSYQMVVLHAMLAVGFGFVSFYSVKHSIS